jgi:hypothetical protein
MYVLGGSKEASMRNLVDGGPPLTLVGGPTVSPALGATCNRDNCFDTGLPETAAWTFLAVSKLGGSGNPFFPIANFGAGPRGTSLYISDTNLVATQGTNPANGNTEAVSAGANFVDPKPNDWFSLCGRGDPALVNASYRYNGVFGRGDGNQAEHVVSPRTIRIGGHYDTGFTRTGEVLFAAIFNRKLSAASADAAQIAIAQFFADTAGITTL